MTAPRPRKRGQGRQVRARTVKAAIAGLAPLFTTPPDLTQPDPAPPPERGPGGTLEEGGGEVSPVVGHSSPLPAIGPPPPFSDQPASSSVKGVTPELFLALEKLVLEGLPLDPALRYLGIELGEDDPAWQRFQDKFKAHGAHLRRAAAAAELADLRRIRAGGKGWQALGWYRERLQTERYGQRQRGTTRPPKQSALGQILADAERNRGTK